MTDHDAAGWERIKISKRIFRQRRARYGKAKIFPNAAPTQSRGARARPALRQQTTKAREQFRVCRRRSCRSWQFEIEIRAARNADFFADEPIRVCYQLDIGIVERSGR